MISNNKIQMHDMIQQMGWDIVQENFPKEPSKWRRLWDPIDIPEAFSRKEVRTKCLHNFGKVLHILCFPYPFFFRG